VASLFRLVSKAPALLLLTLALALTATTGCRNAREAEISDPDALYRTARAAMRAGDFTKALSSYETLEARFPFSPAARQGKLDLMYGYYKSRQPEQAVDAADQFIRENPTHPRVDYAHYIKGLVFFERAPRGFGSWFDADPSQRPPSEARRSFAAFQTVVQQYPESEYAADARKRMIYLRNRLADYEVAVARYYVRRGAWVGALARAKYSVENFDGAPSVREALELMITSYRELGMTELAQQTEQVYRENFAAAPASGEEEKSWWRFW
jgi:outer membrane protein assembly factor BamD